MVLFFMIGLGSTMVSRMILNLRGWSRLREEEMHGMIDLATPRTDDQPRKSSSDFRIPQTRMGQGSYDREASVRIDRFRRSSRQSGGSGEATGTPNRTWDRGVTLQTGGVIIVHNSGLPSVVDTEK
jgi:hypothetical protein